MRRKRKNIDDLEFVPFEYAFSTFSPSLDMGMRMTDFRKANKMRGNLTWAEFERIDKKFADEFREFLAKNQEEVDRRYNEASRNIKYKELERKADRELRGKIGKSKKSKTTNKNVRQGDVLFSQDAVDDLLKKDPTSLTLRQVNKILGSGKLKYDEIAPYYLRLQEIKSKPINYNKPPHVKTAKALITKVFSGRANPSMWIDYPEIINAKLYSVKMGIQYLNEHNKEELENVMREYQPKIKQLLDEMGINDINDINL